MFTECLLHRMHRKDIQLFTADGNDERALTRNYRSSFRVGRILALFIETGTLYIALMVCLSNLVPSPKHKLTDITQTIYIMTSSGVFEGTIEGTMFTIAWGSVVPELSVCFTCIHATSSSSPLTSLLFRPSILLSSLFWYKSI